MVNKWEHFTDDELYMLKRQAIESSFHIVMEDRYSKEEVEIHNQLLNGPSEELKRRGSL